MATDKLGFTVWIDQRAAARQAQQAANSIQQQLNKIQARARVQAGAAGRGDPRLDPKGVSWAPATAFAGGGMEKQLLRTARASKQLNTVWKDLGVTQEQWGDMGRFRQWSLAIQQAEGTLWATRRLGMDIQRAGTAFLAMGTAGAAGAALMAREYMELDDPLQRAARNLELNTGLTDELSNSLRNAADAARYFTPEEQAQGLFLFAAATGATVDSSEELASTLEMMNDIQRMSKLGAVDMSTAVEAVTDVQSQFGLSLGDSAKIAATFVKVAAVSKAEVGDLAQAFSYVGTMSQMANTHFEETAAALNVMARYGVRGTRAGRGLARLLEELIAPSEKAQGVLSEIIDLKELETAEGKFIGLSSAIDLLAERTANMTEAERQRLFAQITSQNALRALLPLIDTQLKARQLNVDAMEEEINIITGVSSQHQDAYIQMISDIYGYEVATTSAVDTMEEYWAQYEGTLTAQADRSRNAWESAMTTIGQVIASSTLPMVEQLAQEAQNFANVIEKNPALARLFGYGVGATVVAGGVLKGVGVGIQVGADIVMMRAANTMMAAAQIEMRAAEMQQVGAGGGGGRGGGLVAAATKVGIGLLVGYMITDAFSQAVTGKHTKDLFNVAEEAARAAEMAREEVAGMERQQLELLIGTLQAERYELERWGDPKTLLFDYPGMGIPDKYQTPFGPSGMLIKEDWAEVNAELKVAQQRLAAVLEPATVREHVTQLESEKENLEGLIWNIQAYGNAWEQWPDLTRHKRELEATNELLEILRERLAEIAALELAAFDEAMMRQAERWTLPPDESMTAWGMTGLTRETEEAVPQMEAIRDRMQDARDKIDAMNRGMQAFRDSGEEANDELSDMTGFMDTINDYMRRWQMPAPWAIRGEMLAGVQSGYESKVFEMVKEGVIGKEEGLNLIRDFQSQASGMAREDLDETAGNLDLRLQLHAATEEGILDAKKERIEEEQRLREKATKDAQRQWEKAQKSFRSFVEAGFKPTEVTRQDLWETRMGIYGDKWDEYVRQLRAAMEGEPEWKHLIPPDLEMGGDWQAVIDWGDRQIDAFYAGLLPDAVNWEGFVRDFQERLNVTKGKELLVQRGIEELAKVGITADRADIAAAFGFPEGGMFAQLYFAGETPAQAGATTSAMVNQALETVTIDPEVVKGTAGAVGGAFIEGVKDRWGASDWTTIIAGIWSSQLTSKASAITNVGEQYAGYFVSGVTSGMLGADLLGSITDAILSQINEGLEAEGPPPPAAGGR